MDIIIRKEQDSSQGDSIYSHVIVGNVYFNLESTHYLNRRDVLILIFTNEDYKQILAWKLRGSQFSFDEYKAEAMFYIAEEDKRKMEAAERDSAQTPDLRGIE